MKFDITSHIANQIKQFYLEILHRFPTEEDLRNHISLLESGKIHITDIPTLMKNSPEFHILQNLEKTGEGPIITKDHVTMYLNPHDTAVSGYLASYKVWEPYETEIMKKFFKKDTNFIDIGAHIGYYSLLCASFVTKGKIIAFEPERQNYEIFQKNISANGFTNVTMFNHAVLDRNDKISLYVGPARNIETSLWNSGDNRFFNLVSEDRCAIEVSCIKLDDFLKDKYLHPSIIKMDIQGAEFLALKGMVKTLKDSDRLALFTEFWPRGILSNGNNPSEFLQLLLSLEFQIYELDKNTNKLLKTRNEELIAKYLSEANPNLQTDLLCLKNMDVNI